MVVVGGGGGGTGQGGRMQRYISYNYDIKNFPLGVSRHVHVVYIMILYNWLVSVALRPQKL